jgi:hypothetical protein
MAVQIPADPYGAVYEVLDETSFTGGVAARTQGTLARALDDLQACSAPVDHLVLVQRISVTFHKLNWATLKRDGVEAQAMRAELKNLSERWREMPLSLIDVHGHA